MSSITSPMFNITSLADDLHGFPAEAHPSDPAKPMNDAKQNVTWMPPYRVAHGCCIWHWTDKLSEAEGWIVIDSPVPTPSGGGLFLHENVTLVEVRDVARSMSSKIAVSCQPQICSAKGGICFPSRDPRASAVLERFIRDNAGVISQYWGTGGDINTDHAIIDQHARTYGVPGTLTALDALRVSLSHTASASFNLAALLEEPVKNSQWPLGELSVGYVMAVVLRELLSRTKPDLIGRARLVLQGFGCVGSTFAYAAKQLGIGKVVAISSQYGYYIDDKGIDCDAIEDARRKAVTGDLLAGLDPKSLEAGLTQDQLSSDLYTKRRDDATDEEHLVDFLAASEAEVFVPCAQRYVLGSKAISALSYGTFATVPRGARFILAGANNVFNPGESKDETLAKLDSAAILMLPEWVSNSGTCSLFMRACSGFALESYGASNLEACANDSKAFLDALFAKTGNRVDNKSLWEACENLAVIRRQAGATNLLGVKRISHLTLTTPTVDRAMQTMTQVYNAKVVKGRSLYQLPGAGDPTISIVEAPQGSGPAEIGLSVRFSVYNLAKARDVLKNEGVAFEERALRDGASELVVEREQAGYPMSLCQAPAREVSNDNFSGSCDTLDSIVGSTRHIDHYATIMPDAGRIKTFHERMMGFVPIRTFTVKAGSTAAGDDDGLMHVMGVPFDTKRVVILTEGLTRESVFSKMLERHCGSFVHHIALQVDDVDAVFAEVREKGWQTTAENLSFDLATGLQQFFLKEEEAGCILEFIGRNRKSSSENDSGLTNKNKQSGVVGSYTDGTTEFGIENIISLARSLDI